MKWACIALCYVAAAAHSQTRVGEVTTDQAYGDATLRAASTAGGATVMSGSAVSASGRAATLKLERGGNVHICPQTTVTASTSASGRELMLALDSGAVELDYDLGASADSLMTPDLRLSIAGPSAVHVAIDVEKSGNVCVASLPSDSAALVVTELAGEGSYQVRPGQQIMFLKGSTANVSTEARGSCGCPAPLPALRAAAPEAAPAQPPAQAETAAAAPSHIAEELPNNPPSAVAQRPAADPEVATHTVVEMDAPMIYNGERPEPPGETVADLKLFRSADSVLLFPSLVLPAQQPAPATVAQPEAVRRDAPKPAHGVFHRFGAFLAALFR